MPIRLTYKQSLLLRTAAMTVIIYLTFKYLIPLLLPFLIAALLSIPIRPAAWFLYKKFRIPMGVAAIIVLVCMLGVLGVGLSFLGRVIVEQLVRLGEQLPSLWDDCLRWLWAQCDQVEQSLHWEQGTIQAQLSSIMGLEGNAGGLVRWKEGGQAAGQTTVQFPGQISGEISGQILSFLGDILGTSLQGAVSAVKMAVSLLVTLFITIGATIITTTQMKEIKRCLDRSVFRREIRQIIDTLTRVGTAYGKTQLIIMLCTVVISAVGLTLMGDPYALLWALVVGLVDALPIFGAGTILWPWLVLSAVKGQLIRTVGLAVIYAVSNLTRQWLEARYMGERIGLSALENLIAMYLGLRLFGGLGLFWGPIGYLLVKESQRDRMSSEANETKVDSM